MKFDTKPVRALAAMALSASLIATVSASAWAADTGPTAEQKQQWVQKHQERIKARLAKAAQMLGISTSQQTAWDTYAAAVLASFPTPGTGKPDGDAASIARMRAERSAAHAQKMAALADATAALQALLTPEQRKTFDQLVQRAGHRGHHGHRMHGAAQTDKK